MPLPADRRRLEWLFRIVAALAMIGMLIGAFTRRNRVGGESVNAVGLAGVLDRWVVAPPAETLGLRLAASPNRMELAYLQALRKAGTPIAWQDEGIAPVLLDAEPLEDPAGGAMVRLSGEDGSVLVISDTLGILDSARIDRVGTGVRVPAFSGGFSVHAGATAASTTIPGSPLHKSVVVLGLAGWESKFVVRALEERGWNVESRIALAPGRVTQRGRPVPLDTARHAAVIALDSSAVSFAGEIHRFVVAGGGLVLGDGAGPYLQRTAPASVGSLMRPVRNAAKSADFRNRLSFRRLGPLREGAIGLEQREGGISLAAWRVGAGRVVQAGYRDTWRWRMEGDDNAAAEHRAWWAGLVAAVAYRSSTVTSSEANPAPLATLALELGPPGALPQGDPPGRLWPIFLAIFLLAILAEWTSRRLGGAD